VRRRLNLRGGRHGWGDAFRGERSREFGGDFCEAQGQRAGAEEERVVIAGDEERDAQGAPLSGWSDFNRDYISNCILGQIGWYAIRESHSFLKQNEGAWDRIRYLA